MHQDWSVLANLPLASGAEQEYAYSQNFNMPAAPTDDYRDFPGISQPMQPTQPMQTSTPTSPISQMTTDDIYTYPQNLQGALKLIEDAVAAENEDRLFYQYLIDQAPTEEEKEIIRGIRENEITHYSLFRQIYSQLTGKMLPPGAQQPVSAPVSYCEGLKKAIRGEQNAVIKYRQILFALQNRVHINMLTEIITDEIRHGSLYNYIYAKNGCKA
ncbi:MAG: ferritin-like domain-containing protein [Clostridia bacterium]|nr:ferritin-like domain-containing protein [Clostridia bacterium]